MPQMLEPARSAPESASPQDACASWRSGVLVLDKPSGAGSNAVLTEVKHLLGLSRRPTRSAGRRQWRSGFLGTLDPLAAGVLPIFIGQATRLIPELGRPPKAYRVGIQLGLSTDTLDIQGAVLHRAATTGLTVEQVTQAICAFEGESEQETPIFSALKYEGKPAYALTRAGHPPIPRRRRVCIWSLKIEEVSTTQAQFHLWCSAGTYMRSLARDIGQRLGVGACLNSLRRTAVGELFHERDSVCLGTLRSAAPVERWALLRSSMSLLPQHASLRIPQEARKALITGQTLRLADAQVEVLEDESTQEQRSKEGIAAKALDDTGALLAIGTLCAEGGGTWRFQPRRVLADDATP